MSEPCFRHFSDFIQTELGIKMPPIKRTMLESRLLKRVRRLGLRSFEEYRQYVFGPEGMERELIHLIDAVTTNKTEFFREADHFNHLAGAALPRLLGDRGAGLRETLRVWSAGCSSGEEPYSIAMVCAEFAAARPGFSFEVLGTDISTRMLEAAVRAVYGQESAQAVPPVLRRKYLLRSRDPSAALVRVAPDLRARVRFQRVNLMDDEAGHGAPFHAVFCRNVLIYFDRANQAAILGRLVDRLVPGGYLYIGHSETLLGLGLAVVPEGPMIYRKAGPRTGEA